ncbi:uncharacterized protein LOC118406311 [Branchiostoma floridae]|uniref:Uncharacterized protein LOC118406311 n=1 Tax=Branchiostoma floridae TaxID=7739 RepID=A0A9J7HMH6_BRAFL|nr:uncharacterized protein LOC118406311 [Branchiostoma floridae]
MDNIWTAGQQMMTRLMRKIWPDQQEVRVLNLTEIDEEEDDEFLKYDFPFENLVFEGGGARGVAYVGTLRVLETAGVLPKIQRVAGVSAGAITATLVALGLKCHEVAEQASVEIGEILISGGFLQKLVKPINLFRRYGWERGDGLYTFLGDILEKYTGNPDITFKQLYDMDFKCKELCIVVTNLDQLTEECCHVKTTPDLPVRKAVRMSMSIPGLFEPVLDDCHGSKEFFVDGGVICNFPLHCFDGWWLSMKEEDSLLNRLDNLDNLSSIMHPSNRFHYDKDDTDRTLGVMLYSDEDVEKFQRKFHDRRSQEEREYESKRPDTETARKYKDKMRLETVEAMENRKKMRSLIDRFLTSLKEQNTEQNSTISRDELHRAFTEAGDSSMEEEDKKKLFGEAYKVDKLFDQMDADKDGQLSYQEIHEFFANKGYSWLTRCMEEETVGLGDYTLKYVKLLDVMGKRAYSKDQDVKRCIGVDSDYVNTTDFDLEDEDKLFLFKQGAIGARAFLRTYIKDNNLKERKDNWKTIRSYVLFAPRRSLPQ